MIYAFVDHEGADQPVYQSRLVNPFVVCCLDTRRHYENTPMQHTAIFHDCKNDNFRLNIFYYIHIFAQNIDCGYTVLRRF